MAWLHLAWYAPLVILALLSLPHVVRHWRSLAPIWLFLFIYPLPYDLTHVTLYRYRYSVEPSVISLAAISLAAWWRRCSPEVRTAATNGFIERGLGWSTRHCGNRRSTR